MSKNILIIGSNSELAQDTISELKVRNYNIHATSRRVDLIDEKVFIYNLDVTNEMDFISLREKISNIQFDTI